MLQAYVSSVSEGMLQVFHMYVAKVDQDVVYVAMSIHMLQPSVRNFSSIFLNVCCKCVYLNIAYVSHIYCRCFVYMLHMFCNSFFKCFLVFCKCFMRMFKVFLLSLDVCCKCFIYIFLK